MSANCAKRKCRVFKNVALNTCAQQVGNLSPTDASASWDRRLAGSLTPYSFVEAVRPSTRRGGFLLSLLLRSVAARVGRRRLHFTKRQFSRLTAGLRLKVREGHSDEFERPSAAGTRNGSGRGRLHAAQALFGSPIPSIGYAQLKVGPFDLHRDGPTARICLLAPGPDIVGHRNHSRLDLNGVGQVLWKSRLRSRRLSFAIRLDLPVVPTSRDVVVPTA